MGFELEEPLLDQLSCSSRLSFALDYSIYSLLCIYTFKFVFCKISSIKLIRFATGRVRLQFSVC